VDWTIQNILKKLTIYDGEFPRKALQEAINNQDKILPELLDILGYARNNIHELEMRADYMAHLYAFYLLAQFRERRAYPLIADFFSIPGEVTVDISGDFVTEDLCRVLASVSGGDPSLMKRLAEDRNASEWVRSAAMDGLLSLMIHDQMSREEVVDYFRGLYRGGLEREPSYVWDGLVSCSCELYPEELLEDVRQAFSDDLIDPAMIDFEWVQKTLRRGKEVVLAKLYKDTHLAFIDDTIKEMQGWACFQPQTLPPKQPIPQVGMPKIGRNDPCPCGSGKKYKKCCGARH
jgi:uncharacterized protein YecA (UPF0149 family)